MEEKETFTYTYSAPEQEEIRRIQEKYLPKDAKDSKIDRLRMLDKKVERSAAIPAIILGIIGTLIFGAGMALSLSYNRMLSGICVSFIGFAMLACALPLHNKILEKQKEKYGPQILELTKELQK